MRLVERHIVKDNRFEDICLKSGLLYNYVLFNVRQGIFSGDYINEYEFSTKLCKENQVDFRNLPSVVSQQVVAQVFSVTKSWMKSKKEYEKNPSKFLSRPKLPKYKKGKKQNMVVFTKNSCRLKEDGCIHFIKNIIRPIKTKIGDNKLCQVRIIPQATCYVVEVIYEKKEQDLNLDKDNFLSIDLGLNNLCTCISNVGIKPFIVNGKIIKSFNQWYNKKRARLMSYIGDKGTSKRLRRLNNYRNFWIEDKIHKVSRFIVNICIENNIGNWLGMSSISWLDLYARLLMWNEKDESLSRSDISSGSEREGEAMSESESDKPEVSRVDVAYVALDEAIRELCMAIDEEVQDDCPGVVTDWVLSCGIQFAEEFGRSGCVGLFTKDGMQPDWITTALLREGLQVHEDETIYEGE